MRSSADRNVARTSWYPSCHCQSHTASMCALPIMCRGPRVMKSPESLLERVAVVVPVRGRVERSVLGLDGPAVDQFADQMQGEDVHLLDPGRLLGRYDERQVGRGREVLAADRGEGHRAGAPGPRRCEPLHYRRRSARGAETHDHVLWTNERGHLAREDVVVGVIVGDAAHHRRVADQRDRGKRPAFTQVATDQLTRQMLRVGGRTTVAERVQHATRLQPADQLFGHGLDLRELLPHRLGYLRMSLELPVEQPGHRQVRHASPSRSCAIAAAPSTPTASPCRLSTTSHARAAGGIACRRAASRTGSSSCAPARVTPPPSTTSSGSQTLMSTATIRPSIAVVSSHTARAIGSPARACSATSLAVIDRPASVESDPAAASAARRAIDVPDTYASAHPRAPQPHWRPCQSTTT